MKFNRQHLLDVITSIRTEHDEKDAVYVRGWVDHVNGERQEWENKSRPQWELLRDRITSTLRKKQPITRELMREVFGGDRWGSPPIPFYAAPRDEIPSQYSDKRDKTIYRPKLPPQLASLEQALLSFTDDEVSNSALTALGYRNLSWLFSAAVGS